MRWVGFALIGVGLGVAKSEFGFSWPATAAIYAATIGMLLIIQELIKDSKK